MTADPRSRAQRRRDTEHRLTHDKDVRVASATADGAPYLSMATRTDTQSPALHVADSHDLIRVHGAGVNNLKDVSVEIPKRRLTVFTGVSGSGKSSLVFGTIAAESQRMINETYSAFVQGFMPTLARPEVDVLEGLTTAIIVDQERMGTDARSTVGTATDANAMLHGTRPSGVAARRPDSHVACRSETVVWEPPPAGPPVELDVVVERRPVGLGELLAALFDVRRDLMCSSGDRYLQVIGTYRDPAERGQR
jgi:ABC-type glutathione transport system ATPase component